MDTEHALAGVLAGMPAWSGGGAEDLVVGGDPVRQRIALFERIERGAQDGLLDVLRIAADSRADAERYVEQVLRHQSAACAELAEAVATLQRERQQLPDELERERRHVEAELQAQRSTVEAACQGELAEAEREGQRQLAEAQEELARLRTKTQAEVDQMLAEAKGRRAAAASELQALETQVEQVRQMMDVFVHRRIQSLRGNLAHDASAG